MKVTNNSLKSLTLKSNLLNNVICSIISNINLYSLSQKNSRFQAIAQRRVVVEIAIASAGLTPVKIEN
ncbi:hypothetical protein [Nostoc sp.]|uniref:hypothetical protein n=1 Tax=Nostoc sp. TaxID=1180 RepID=UPI002FFB5141